MDILIYKILLMVLFCLIPAIINYFLLYKLDRKYCLISEIVICIISLIYFIFDYFIFKNDLIGYIAFSLLSSFLLSITFEDIKTRLMDTRVIIGYFIAFLIYRIIFFDLSIFLEGLIGFVLSLIIMLIGYYIKRDSIGIGDIEVIAACGMIIGFPNIFHFLFKAFLFVLIYGIYLFIRKKVDKVNKNVRKKKKDKQKTSDEIPLAPFLLLASII